MPTGKVWKQKQSELRSGFNPCSSGWCLPATGKSASSSIRVLFQSLFFWMMPTGRYAMTAAEAERVGFNPCSSGWCLPARQRGKSDEVYICVSILVLLDDAYRRLAESPETSNSLGFNPCSSGWCLPAIALMKRLSSLLSFQSLFFWMMPTGTPLSPTFALFLIRFSSKN